MPIALHNIKSGPGAKKPARRVGRGGKRGAYSGRGMKGQRSRSGGKKSLKLKGMKTMILGLPKKRGFRSFYQKPQIVNLSDLERHFKDGEKVNPVSLKKKGLVDRIKSGVKILGQGELTRKVVFSNCLFSKSAREKAKRIAEIK